MDLLQDYNNKNKKQKSKGQKIVLTLLVISIVLCCIIGVAIAYLSIQGEAKTYTFLINNNKIDATNLNWFTTEKGEEYLSLRLLCNYFGYSYKNGEMNIPGEEQSQGYIDNKINIIQFFADSEKIYKTQEESNLDYEYYYLQKPIIQKAESLYIYLGDLPQALNIIVNYSQEDNQTIIKSPEHIINEKSETMKAQNITISDMTENNKALAYGYMIINKDGKYGVNSLANDEIIGNKYNSITFNEYTGDFIVSNNNNKFGIITKDSKTKINLIYDSIEILNYNPLLYKVEKLGKYGVMTENGNIIGRIEYDSIAYPENKDRGINYTLIVPEINENIPESIVVCKEEKYGLIELDTGNEVVECTLKGLYSATDEEGVDYYIIETEKEQAFLEKYIESLNRMTGSMNN